MMIYLCYWYILTSQSIAFLHVSSSHASKVAMIACFYCMGIVRCSKLKTSDYLFTQWTLHCPAGTWRKYNVASTSMQRHDIASTLRQHYIYVMCPLGGVWFCSSWSIAKINLISSSTNLALISKIFFSFFFFFLLSEWRGKKNWLSCHIRIKE